LERFSNKYSFEKPNDKRALDLMNAAAKAVMMELSDVVVGYGVSDEFRYVWFRKVGRFGLRVRLKGIIVSCFINPVIFLREERGMFVFPLSHHTFHSISFWE